MKRNPLIVLILGTSVSLFLPLPEQIRPFFGAIQAFLVPGIAVISLLWNRGRFRVDDLFLSIALSPVLLTLAALAAGLVMSVSGAARTAAWFWYALLALSLLVSTPRGASENDPAAEAERPVEVPWSVVALSLAYGALVLGAYAWNPYLLWRSDAWYHASVTAEILERGTPPGEPWLAGVPIRYMWIYHLFNAVWIRLSGLTLFPALGALNVASAAVFPYLAGRFASVLTEDRRKVFLVTLLTVAGFESASWVLWPLAIGRAFFGEVRGVAEIARSLDLHPFDTRVIFNLHPYGTWMANLTDKFLTVTAFSYSLCLFLLALGMSVSRAARSGKAAGTFAVSLIATAGAFLFHVITGTVLIAASIGAAALFLIHARLRGGALPHGRDWLLPPLAAAVAAVAVFPYFLSLRAGGGGGGDGTSVHLVLRTAFTIIAPLVLLAVPAWMALRRLVRERTGAVGMVRWWILCMLLLCLVVDLPSVNESKLVFPFFLAAGPLVFIEALSLARSSRRLRYLTAAWLILLYAPPPLLTFGGFIRSGPVGPDEHLRAAAFHEQGLFRWVRGHTAETAVIAEPGRLHLMPVFARRRDLASGGGVLNVVGYGGPRVRLYRELNDAVFAGDEIGTGIGEMIGESGLDLYAVLYRAGGASPAAVDRLNADPSFRKVYEDDFGVLFRAVSRQP